MVIFVRKAQRHNVAIIYSGQYSETVAGLPNTALNR